MSDCKQTTMDVRRCADCGREWEAPMGSPFVCPGCGLTSTLLGTHPLPTVQQTTGQFPPARSEPHDFSFYLFASYPRWCCKCGLTEDKMGPQGSSCRGFQQARLPGEKANAE